MTEHIRINKILDDDERYRLLIPQLKALLTKEDKLISNLSNLAVHTIKFDRGKSN